MPGTVSDEVEDKLKAELEMDDLELIDICEIFAAAKREAITNKKYADKVKTETSFGIMIKAHYEVLKEFDDIPAELERNWTYQVKPGDALLPEEKWNKFVTYKNQMEEISKTHYLWLENSTETKSDLSLVHKTEIDTIFATVRAPATLLDIWLSWQRIFNASSVRSFTDHLRLVQEAATLNGFDSVQEYWEALSDFQGAYDQAQEFWDEILPFYKRFYSFVRSRLFKYYNISQDTEEISVYLLGTQSGSDWSNIADIILPHPQVHYDVESYLKFKDVKELYKYSENIALDMGLGPLGDKFWENSRFNTSTLCGPEIMEFCGSGYTEIAVCNKLTWKAYLDAHETALKVALNNIDYDGLTRHKLRFSGIDSAVETLGSIIAVDSLSYHGILEQDAFEGNNSASMTKLLLTAVRVMPRLVYYLMADKWRLGEIKPTDENVMERYWKFRKTYTGIRGWNNKEAEFLHDPYITANRPYISKFFGTLVAFQLLDYYKERSESYSVEDIRTEGSFMAMLRDRDTSDWPQLLSLHYGLDISANELLKYFEPLEQYFETAPVEQVPVVTTTSTTSTTTTTTSTTTTTTTVRSPSTPVDSESDFSTVDSLAVDQLKLNDSRAASDSSSGTVKDSHVGMWVGVSLSVMVACLLVAGYGYKLLKKKRRTNNRRFDT